MKFQLYSIIGIIIIITSCSKKMDLREGSGTVRVKISTSLPDFTNTEIKASYNSIENSIVQDTIITLNDKFLLRAEITTEPINNSKITKKADLKADRHDLAQDIWFKLVVFKNGDFVEEYDIQHSVVSSYPNLTIDRGATYTFIAYSVKSTTQSDLPALQNSAGAQASKTLSNTYINESRHVDLVYFKGVIQTTTTDTSVDLNIIFEHQFSQIQLEINSNGTKNGSDGYPLEAVEGNFINSLPTARKDFGTGVTTRSGTETRTAFTLSANPTDSYIRLLDVPKTINMASGGPTFELTKITAGGYSIYYGPYTGNQENFLLTKSMKPFTNITLIPGHRHYIKLSLTNTDEYLDHAGQKAIRLSGEIWMLHNLGANNTTYIPTKTSPIADLYGKYYQFGKKLPISSAPVTSLASPISTVDNWTTTGTITTTTYLNWNTIPASNNTSTTYYTSPYDASKNATYDPCPVGYRVPNDFELIRLQYSTWDTYESDRAILTSKRKKGVFLIAPLQGKYLPQATNGAFNPVLTNSHIAYFWGSYVHIYTSTPPQGYEKYGINLANFYLGRARYFLVVTVGLDAEITNGSYSTLEAMPIRCIAER